MKKLLYLFVVIFIVSCGKNEIILPKPPTYLRLNLPKHSYREFIAPCGYLFMNSTLFKVKNVYDSLGRITCHKDIDLGILNGTIHLSYIQMNQPLSTYVNYSNNKVDEHKLKATAIIDKQIIRKQNRVFGTFFELHGNVASPFQFYLTDSTERFVSAVVYFNSIPNYDSLKPTLDYLKVDLIKMMNSFKWEK